MKIKVRISKRLEQDQPKIKDGKPVPGKDGKPEKESRVDIIAEAEIEGGGSCRLLLTGLSMKDAKPFQKDTVHDLSI